MLRRPSMGDFFVACAAWVFLVAFRAADGTELWLYGLMMWFLLMPFQRDPDSESGGRLSMAPLDLEAGPEGETTVSVDGPEANKP